MLGVLADSSSSMYGIFQHTNADCLLVQVLTIEVTRPLEAPNGVGIRHIIVVDTADCPYC